MASNLGRHVAAWEARAVQAEARADAEARRRVRAEQVAACGPETLRDLHLELAALHGINEERHRASARMHRSLIRQVGSQGERYDRVGVGQLLATAVAEASRCPSSAIVLLAGDGRTADFVATDSLAEAAEDLEFVHDEGPLHAACAGGASRLVTMPEIRQEWPHYGPELAALGVRTVFAAPLRAGAGIIGAVGLFDPPSSGVAGEPLVGLANGVTHVVLDAGPSEVPAEGLGFDGMREIHQAAGVVAAELGCETAAALALLRARAFASGESAATVAHRILSGDLHLSL